MNAEKFLLLALVVTIVMVTFYVIFLRERASGNDDIVSPENLYTVLSGQTKVFWNEVPIGSAPPYINPTTNKPFKMKDIKRITFKGITNSPINIDIRVPYEKLKIHNSLGDYMSPTATTKPSLTDLVIDNHFTKYYTLYNVNQ